MSNGELQPRRGVAVVIPTIGRPTLVGSVAAVLGDVGVDEVVVVADGEGDEVRAGLSEFADEPRLRIVAGAGRGAAWARQRGAEVTTAPIVLFLDDDVFPSPGLASAHARRHGDREDLVVVGYMPVGEPYLTAATARVYANDYLMACRHLDEDPGRILTDLWAGNLSLSRTTIEKVPLVVADSPYLRREDQEFGLRCARAGLTGVFDRSLTAEHQFNRSLRQFLTSAREQALEIAQMREQYPEVPDHDAGATQVDGLLGLLRKAASVPPFGYALRGAAHAGVIGAGRIGAVRFEAHGVALLRMLVQHDAAARGRATGSGSRSL
ncbi:MAG: glycosyltransferase family 2 protein [Acidimicrobiia bacterium]